MVIGPCNTKRRRGIPFSLGLGPRGGLSINHTFAIVALFPFSSVFLVGETESVSMDPVHL